MANQPNIAWVFPGQGSQYVEMGKQWFDTFSTVKDHFKRADARLNFSLSRLIFDGPESDLLQTSFAQPAILTLSVAIAEVLKNEYGLLPTVLAGHSLGEYSALVVSGVLTFEEAVDLVHFRGKYMQDAVPLGLGSMSAVLGLEDSIVEEVCREASDDSTRVEPANYNCPGQLVISGHIAALERAEALLKEKGAKRCIRLQVSAPFHSRLLRPAGEKLAEKMSGLTFKTPIIPYVANVNAQRVDVATHIPRMLSDQVWNPVLWTQSIQKLHQEDAPLWLEVGPGKALQGLVRKCVGSDAILGFTNTPNEFDPNMFSFTAAD